MHWLLVVQLVGEPLEVDELLEVVLEVLDELVDVVELVVLDVVELVVLDVVELVVLDVVELVVLDVVELVELDVVVLDVEEAPPVPVVLLVDEAPPVPVVLLVELVELVVEVTPPVPVLALEVVRPFQPPAPVVLELVEEDVGAGEPDAEQPAPANDQAARSAAVERTRRLVRVRRGPIAHQGNRSAR